MRYVFGGMIFVVFWEDALDLSALHGLVQIEA